MDSHKTLIAVPSMDTMPVQTVYSFLNLKRDCPSRFSFIVRASCHDARNLLAREAIESKADRVLWIDSDMVFDDDMMIRLGKDLDTGWDMVCAIYFRRELPTRPVIYKSIDANASRAECFFDYPENQVFPIAGCGFGAVLMTTELLRSVGDRPFTPINRLSEDLSFCWLAKNSGAKIACDSLVKVGHVGEIVYNEQMYKSMRKH